MWTVTRKAPTLLCRLFHRGAWWSNDYGTWYSLCRTSFEVLCCQCGECWTQERGKEA